MQVILDSIAPAVVSFAIGLGLGKMFGKTHGYEVEPSQELIAQAGFSEIKVLIFCNRLHTHKKYERKKKV